MTFKLIFSLITAVGMNFSNSAWSASSDSPSVDGIAQLDLGIVQPDKVSCTLLSRQKNSISGHSEFSTSTTGTYSAQTTSEDASGKVTKEVWILEAGVIHKNIGITSGPSNGSSVNTFKRKMEFSISYGPEKNGIRQIKELRNIRDVWISGADFIVNGQKSKIRDQIVFVERLEKKIDAGKMIVVEKLNSSLGLQRRLEVTEVVIGNTRTVTKKTIEIDPIDEDKESNHWYLEEVCRFEKM